MSRSPSRRVCHPSPRRHGPPSTPGRSRRQPRRHHGPSGRDTRESKRASARGCRRPGRNSRRLSCHASRRASSCGRETGHGGRRASRAPPNRRASRRAGRRSRRRRPRPCRGGRRKSWQARCGSSGSVLGDRKCGALKIYRPGGLKGNCTALLRRDRGREQRPPTARSRDRMTAPLRHFPMRSPP